MARVLTPEQLELLSAARRHVADAEFLLSSGAHSSPDQAWHLAGFGPECLRKACLEDRALDRAIGHDLGPDAEALLDWGLSLDPHAWRYDLAGWSGRAPCLGEWRPDHRYERTGTRRPDDVSELVQAARTFLDRVQADLWADGRVSGSEI